MIFRKLRLLFFGMAKIVGLFALSRMLTRDQLRILCYHGAAIDDEHLFRPMLFMEADTFARRMRFLHESGYPVLRLDEAVKRLGDGSLPRATTVITIDDGWYGTLLHMAPILFKYHFPATLYISTYYVTNETQVFNVALGYVLWKTRVPSLDISKIDKNLAGIFAIKIDSHKKEAFDRIMQYANSLDGANARQSLFHIICHLLDVDISAIERGRLLSYMNKEEVSELNGFDVDLQLHCHRHVFPDTDIEAARREIDENREVLLKMKTGETVHFCYPSGRYKQEQIPWLRQFGIKTAVTTKPGMNRAGESLLQMRRIIDSNDISMVEFEAEISGFKHILRSAKFIFFGDKSFA